MKSATLTRKYFNKPVRVRLITEVQAEVDEAHPNGPQPPG